MPFTTTQKVDAKHRHHSKAMGRQNQGNTGIYTFHTNKHRTFPHKTKPPLLDKYRSFFGFGSKTMSKNAQKRPIFSSIFRPPLQNHPEMTFLEHSSEPVLPKPSKEVSRLCPNRRFVPNFKGTPFS